MNRRDALTAIASLPVVGSLKVVQSEPMPVLAVLEFDDYLPERAFVSIREQWRELFGDKPPFPVMILEGGAKMNFVSQKKAEEIARNNESSSFKVDG